MEKENIIFRVTSFKSNGSVWTKTYEDEKKLLEVLPVLYTQFPHVMVSRQTLKKPKELFFAIAQNYDK